MRKMLSAMSLVVLVAAPSLSWAAGPAPAAAAAVASNATAMVMGGSNDGGGTATPAAPPKQTILSSDPEARAYETDNWTWKDDAGHTCRWSEEVAGDASSDQAHHWRQVCQ